MSNFFFEDDFLFDSHCHLAEAEFDQTRDAVVERSLGAGVQAIIDVAVDLPGAHRTIQNAEKYPGVVFAAVGLDPDVLIPGSDIYSPNAGEDLFDDAYNQLKQLLTDNRDKIKAVGETGIDNYWMQKAVDEGRLTEDEREQILIKQTGLFLRHIELAAQFNLPLTIHSRRAEQLAWDTLKQSGKNVRGVFHSFTGEYDVAKQILDGGSAIGVNAIATYRNAEEVREMLRKVLGKVSEDWSPADFYSKGIYFETDGPYLPPVNKRGQVNEPGNVPEIITSLISLL